MVFVEKELTEQSVLQKLFRQYPQENALIEINNVLASGTVIELTEEMVSEIERKYKVDVRKEFSLNLQELYVVYLNHCLGVDGRLSESNHKSLAHLRSVFRIDQVKVETLHQMLGYELYRRSFKRRIDSMGGAEKVEDKLLALAKELNLPESQIQCLRQEEFDRYAKSFYDEIIKKNRLSENEEMIFKALAAELGVHAKLDKEIKDKLQRARSLWTLENGPIKAIEVTIPLQKNEACYAEFPMVSWHELRSQKGVRSPRLLYQGRLYLTNKRLIFESVEKQTAIKYNTVSGVYRYENCLEIRKQTGRNPLLESDDVERLSIIITRLLHQKFN